MTPPYPPLMGRELTELLLKYELIRVTSVHAGA